MPAVSEAQRRFLYATKGAAWVQRHGFDNKGPLPAHKSKGVKPRSRSRSRGVRGA